MFGARQDDAAGALAQWGVRLRFFVYEAVGRLRIDQVGGDALQHLPVFQG